MKRLTLILILLMRNNSDFAQIANFYKENRDYYLLHSFNYFDIKQNKVKSIEISGEEYIEEKKLKKTYKEIVYFDSLGYLEKEIYLGNNDKKTKTYCFISDLENINNIDKNVVVVYKSYDSINNKILSQFRKHKIKGAFIFSPSSVSEFDYIKNKLQLQNYYVFDSLHNIVKAISVEKSDNIFDTTVINYEYDYINQIFKSYTFQDKEKILISAGNLGYNSRIINENFYWLKYTDINYDNINAITPTFTNIYSIDQNGLMHQSVSLSVSYDFWLKLSNNQTNSNGLVKTSNNKFVKKMRYEYYK